MTSALLTPFQLNNTLTLKNRILMAPMTRASASSEGVPTQEMVEYYQRRADAGLIVTEGTIIRPDGRGHANVPGIYSEAQIEGWREVTLKVHAAGGKIFLQIWHVGRVSHPDLLNGELPLSASATEMSGPIARSNGLEFGKSRELSIPEIKQLVLDYATAARNAMEAGFDGVEIHGANGYLIDQFMHVATNHRTDEYGGNAEKNSRFALEVVKACGETIGFERVAIRLSPGGYLNQIQGEAADAETFAYLLSELNNYPLAYLHTGNFNDKVAFTELQERTMTAFLRAHYRGNLVACGSYSELEAIQGIAANEFDLVAFGRPFIANPDLINKLAEKKPLIAYDNEMLKKLF